MAEEFTADQLSTPLMRQYREIKSRYRDAILFFRLGDFYEMFFEDAETAAPILDIALTTRDKNAANPIPLCGVPYQSATSYISLLLDKGHKVAICEQVEDPKTARGIVRRDVIRVVTPGLRGDEEGLASREANPLVSAYAGKHAVGLAWIDVSSGRFGVTKFAAAREAFDEVARLAPQEILLPEGKSAQALAAWAAAFEGRAAKIRLERIPEWVYDRAERKLCERFRVASLEGFGIFEPDEVAPAAAALLHYVEDQNRTTLPHLEPPRPYRTGEHLHLDPATREHLEIFRSRGEPGSDRSLVGLADHTCSAMGARRLRDWFHFPLRDLAAIRRRLDAVEELSAENGLREGLRKDLSHLHDLERLIGRIAVGRANGRDLVALRSTLERVAPLGERLERSRADALLELRARLDPHHELAGLLGRALDDDPPAATKEGGIIRRGYHAQLDELRDVAGGGRRWIAEMESRERERTGIASLKIRYNRVFGYTIDVTKANLERVPADYERRQTLAGSERFVTPELREQERKILGAEEKICALEYEIFEAVRTEAAAATRSIQELAAALAELDVFCSLARLASRYRYVRPRVNDGDRIRIRAGRHPVVERFLLEVPFVPNDIDLDTSERQLVILTGPNMSGKSTVMRQVALIVLLAQVGSFVPADEAEIGLADRIFTRVGASDDLTRGQSTFMVEMNETANILRNATRKSLILLDEIGRGTSTFDGLSIAWAVAEEIHDRIGARTIFATHYHELTDLARTKARVRNMNVSVREWGDKIIFLHSLAEGAVNRSYGIDVARLAGVPPDVIHRAREILANLERGELDAAGKPFLARAQDRPPASADQLELFRRLSDELARELRAIDPDELTPRSAHELVSRWRDRVRNSEES